MSDGKVTVAYWKIRGLAQALRFICEYASIPYENVMYAVDPITKSRDAWFSVKPTLGLDFPNLPYIIDGELKFTQSNACLRYLGRKAGLCGGSDAELAIQDMLIDQVMDLRNGFVRLCYGASTYDEELPKYRAALDAKFSAFVTFLADKTWLQGEDITAADFHMVEMVDQHMELFENFGELFPTLKAYRDRFFNLPKIKAYVASDRFFAHPINNVGAAFV